MHKNLITDVPGLAVGNFADARLRSGTTAVVFDEPAVASASVLGGAPGGWGIETLNPEMQIPAVDALVLSGGSAFGLEAASGVQAYLRERGRGLAIGPAVVPIVAGAILFDLLNGGDKAWGRFPPYRDFGYLAAGAAGREFALGSVGAGFGATTVSVRGGLGSASAVTADGVTVGALAAVNALGSPIVGAGPHFWAAAWEMGSEFGGLGSPARPRPEDLKLAWKGGPSPQPATTIAIVATDAILTKAEAKRVAIAAHGGLARALRLAQAPMDGDTVFAASTGRRPLGAHGLTEVCAVAADCLARAIARGVYEAAPNDTTGGVPSWKQEFGG